MVSVKLCLRYNNYSKQLLHHFVSESLKLYGPDFVVYDVHELVQLPDDVLRFGPVKTSAISFLNVVSSPLSWPFNLMVTMFVSKQNSI